MKDQKETAVLIIAYNEDKTIGEIINEISEEYDVYVADDGSTDNTAIIAKNFGAKVISLSINLGQGAAAIVGYKIVASENYTFLVKMDGDGQHNPKEITSFIKKLKNSNSDMIVGSRNLGQNYKEAPLARKMFLSPLTWLLNKLTGYKLSDSMCGFRAFRGKSLNKMISIFEKIVEPEYMASEMLIRFAQEGILIEEVPISLTKRKHGLSYKGLFRYGWGVISTILRTKLDIFKY